MFAEGDLESTGAFDAAFQLAQRVGDRDVQMLALSGQTRLHQGRGIEKGLALLDEATASAMCGDLRAIRPASSTITISSCRDLGDYRRRPNGRRRRTSGATAST
jgi:hypothetical protein